VQAGLVALVAFALAAPVAATPDDCEPNESARLRRWGVPEGRSLHPALAASDHGFVVVWTQHPGSKRLYAQPFFLDGRLRNDRVILRREARGANGWTQSMQANDDGRVAISFQDKGLVWVGSFGVTELFPKPRLFAVAEGGPRPLADVAIAAGDEREAFVAWRDPDTERVAAARVVTGRGAKGTPVSSAVATERPTWQPAIDIAPGGERVVIARVEQTEERATSRSIVVRVLDRVGEPVGPPIVTEAAPQVEAFAPRVAVARDGRFVVSWNAARTKWVGAAKRSRRIIKTIRARVYDADGSPLSEPFDVDEEADDFLTAPVVDDAPGGFAISWLREGWRSDVMVRWFDWTGAPRTTALKVGSNANRSHQMVVTARGVEVHAWSSRSFKKGEHERIRGVVARRCRRR
jgi:hypothetical protein